MPVTEEILDLDKAKSEFHEAWNDASPEARQLAKEAIHVVGTYARKFIESGSDLDGDPSLSEAIALARSLDTKLAEEIARRQEVIRLVRTGAKLGLEVALRVGVAAIV